MENRMTVDVVIPVYKPGQRFGDLLRRLGAQTVQPEQIIIMNTEKTYWDQWMEQEGNSLPLNAAVHHVTKETFDHGATRHAGILYSNADVVVLMTDDALPADTKLFEQLLTALKENSTAAVAYGRQLAKKDCGVIERYTRSFNYPEESRLKTGDDFSELGIKTYFCSNVCAAYRREIYLSLGGFIKKTIFNEDMIFAARAMEAGYGVYYAAKARVYHSHNYGAIEQFHRNFDLAVSQADHPEVFSGIRSEGEGIRLVKKTAVWLIKNGHSVLLFKLAVHSGFKYLGYFLGKRYRHLPKPAVRWCSMNKNYWKG